jgi:hypothetical protein
MLMENTKSFFWENSPYEIPIFKHQITNKFEISMTETKVAISMFGAPQAD